MRLSSMYLRYSLFAVVAGWMRPRYFVCLFVCFFVFFFLFFILFVLFFFFQAEDGIRDWSVTGVQTCALPISCDFPLLGILCWLGNQSWFFLQTHSCPKCTKEIIPNGEELHLARQSA